MQEDELFEIMDNAALRALNKFMQMATYSTWARLRVRHCCRLA
jgi:hypothetical protein